MVGVTLICLFCGFAVNYPQEAKAFAAISILLLPTVGVWRLLVWFSTQPILVSISVLSGSVTILVIMTLLSSHIDLLALAIAPAAGGAIFGSLQLATETTPHHVEH